MIYVIMESKMLIDPAAAVRRLAHEHPGWLPVLEAAIVVAKRAEAFGGEFPGTYVAEEVGYWIPNLRILATYGLLEKAGPSTRGGRRAYYRMPNRAVIEHAFEAWQVTKARTPTQLRFVAAGASREADTDAGRRAGELDYEPRSWR